MIPAESQNPLAFLISDGPVTAHGALVGLGGAITGRIGPEITIGNGGIEEGAEKLLPGLDVGIGEADVFLRIDGLDLGGLHIRHGCVPDGVRQFL